MHVKIGRNDPCPCGSGKKHKLCCLQNRGVAPLTFPANVRARALAALLQFTLRDEIVPLRAALLERYFGPGMWELSDAQRQRVLQNEQCMDNFLHWFLLEASFEGPSRTLVNRLLSHKGHVLPLPDRRYLEAMRDSHLRLYEVEAVELDEGLRLRDCWDGTTYDVRERMATHQLATHSVVALRLRPDPDGAVVIDGPGFGGFTQADKEEIISHLSAEHEAVLKKDGNADGRFAYYPCVAIAQHVIYKMLLRPPPRLTTTTGEPVSLCKLVFGVPDRDAVRASLEKIKELSPDNEDDSYVWVRGKNRIIHASIHFENGRLVAETHSLKRAVAVRKLLERHLGDAARYERMEEQDPQTALAEYRAQRPEDREPQMPAIPSEVEERVVAEYEERHYRSWIDLPVPALANKTPRQAVRSRALRNVLVGLLKDFSAAAELHRRSGKHAYDFSWMWGELGIDPKDPMSMRASRTPAKRGVRSGLIYRLKISLYGVKPPIWRRVALSANEPLDRVHMILNCAMGWMDGHLHAFEICGTRYSVPDPDSPGDNEDERKARLGELPLTVGSSFYYWYDFGDGWKHRVTVEAIESADGAVAYPVCEAGRRSCPPEDIGGTYGYADLVKSPARWPDHGYEGFDPEAFDVRAVNETLRQLPKKWRPLW